MSATMSAVNRKGPIYDPGLCRCCGAMKKCRLLNTEYESFGQKEVYSDMIMDCFGLLLSHLDGKPTERLVCATCVTRIREALNFRRQVLRCEEAFLQMKIYDTSSEQVCEMKPKLEIEIKEEDALSNSDSQDTQEDTKTADGTTKHIAAIDIKIEPIGPQHYLEEPSTCQISLTPTVEMKNNTKAVQMEHTSNEAEQGKKEMLLKLKEMKQKLLKIKNAGQPNTVPKTRPVSVDKDLNGIKNTVTIVENSYVCPFVSVFSDYYCVYCREMFTNPDQLREHTLTHDPKTYESVLDTKKLILVDIHRIDCRLCEEKIDSLEVFKSHITSVHGKHIYSDTDNEFIKFKLKYGTLTCIECDRTFTIFHSLKTHMAEHFGTYICDVCGAHYFEERRLTFHKKKSHSSKKDQVFPCAECDKTFRSNGSRTLHVARIHKNEAAYPCNKCDEVFISYSVRYRHKIAVHGEHRSYPCESCPKTFDSRKALWEHNQKYHLQSRRHECDLCDKKFYLPSALRDHMTTHTGEKNFRCEYCGKNYSRAKALRVHMQSHGR